MFLPKHFANNAAKMNIDRNKKTEYHISKIKAIEYSIR